MVIVTGAGVAVVDAVDEVAALHMVGAVLKHVLTDHVVGEG